MDFLQNLFDQSQYALLSAFLLGLMTAVSPCPLATNITAIGFLGQDISNRRKVFFNGLFYTLGRAFSYTLLAAVLYAGASKLNVSMLFQGWGEKVLGPLLIVVGLFMLGVLRINLPGFSSLTEKIGERSRGSYLGAFLLGVVFALAFCPYSGVLYFALLIPLTLSSPEGLLLPVTFAIATGLPVVLFAWLLAFAVGRVGRFYEKVKRFEQIVRKVVAVLFILTGLYFVVLYFISL